MLTRDASDRFEVVVMEEIIVSDEAVYVVIRGHLFMCAEHSSLIGPWLLTKSRDSYIRIIAHSLEFSKTLLISLITGSSFRKTRSSATAEIARDADVGAHSLSL